jgi:hypothetical protein
MCCSFVAGDEVVKQTSKQLTIEANNIFNSMNGTIKGYLIK